MSRRNHSIFILMITFFVLISVAIANAQTGKTSTLSMYTILGTTKENLDKIVSASVKKDNYGILELMKQGRAFGVEAGNKVLIIDSTFTLYQVRILSGAMTGRSGWIPKEFIQ